MQNPNRLEILAFTDPVCTWCWGSEPVLRKLTAWYGDAVHTCCSRAAGDGRLDVPDLTKSSLESCPRNAGLNGRFGAGRLANRISAHSLKLPDKSQISHCNPVSNLMPTPPSLNP